MNGHDAVKLEKAWLESEEAKSLLRTTGFCDPRMQVYLENRIIRAFRAGRDATEKFAREEGSK